MCYPEWKRYDNYAGSLTGSWQETPTWNFGDCLSKCVGTPGCIGVELRNQPGIPSACRYYQSSDRNALLNVTLTAFVTQYSITNTCVRSEFSFMQCGICRRERGKNSWSLHHGIVRLLQQLTYIA